jgi:hypothetical protein
MREIPLTQGKIALVDDDDFEELNKYKWCARVREHTSYAERKESKTRKIIRMHREVLKYIPDGMFTDHIDGNGLNNQKYNLRIVTTRQNAQNRHQIKTSKYPGVVWHSRDKKWYARIIVDGKQNSLGYYDLEDDAANAYNIACKNPYKIQKEIQTSQYKGVYWNKDASKWKSRISYNGKRYNLGTYDDEFEAFKTYVVAKTILSCGGDII